MLPNNAYSSQPDGYLREIYQLSDPLRYKLAVATINEMIYVKGF